VTGDELQTVLARLGITQVGLGRLVGVDGRTVRRWIAGDAEVPGPVAAWLDLYEHFVHVPPPTGTADVDAEARAVLRPRLHRLAEAWIRAGRHEAELMAAILSITVDAMIDAAGAEAARETLREALAEIDRDAAEKEIAMYEIRSWNNERPETLSGYEEALAAARRRAAAEGSLVHLREISTSLQCDVGPDGTTSRWHFVEKTPDEELDEVLDAIEDKR